MRVLAYGGTRYATRVRVGPWPALDLGRFDDVHGLDPGIDHVSLGVGFFDDRPTLLLRTRQHPEDRGGYAYTLLLDPGDVVWRRHAWNAARCLKTVLADPSLRELALDHPEGLADSQVASNFVDRLADAASRPRETAGLATDAAARGPWQSPLEGPAASIAEAVLMSMFGPLVATTGGHCVLPGRALVDSLADTFEFLPPRFRLGGGWLIGGRPDSQRTFGVNLIVETHGEDAPGTLFERAGDVRLADVALVLSHIAEHAGLDEPPSGDRVWERQWLEGVADVAHLLRAPAVDDEIAACVSRLLQPGHPWAQHVQTFLLARVPADGSLSDGVSRLLVRIGRRQSSLPRHVVDRLSPHAIAEQVRTEGCPPQDVISAWSLAAPHAAAVWRELLAAAAAPDETANVLTEALRWSDSLDPVDEGRAREFVGCALARFAAGRWRLRALGALTPHPVVRHALVDLSRRRLLEHPGRAAGDYLQLGDDPGGSWIAQHAPAALDTVAARALRDVTDGSAGASCRRWLEALHDNPARTQLPLLLRRRVASVIGGPWVTHDALARLVLDDGPALALAPVEEAERACLVHDLPALVDVRRTSGGGGPRIDVRAITALLGQVPPSPVLQEIVRVAGPGRVGAASVREEHALLVAVGERSLADVRAIQSWTLWWPAAVDLGDMTPTALEQIAVALLTASAFPPAPDCEVARAEAFGVALATVATAQGAVTQAFRQAAASAASTASSLERVARALRSWRSWFTHIEPLVVRAWLEAGASTCPEVLATLVAEVLEPWCGPAPQRARSTAWLRRAQRWSPTRRRRTSWCATSSPLGCWDRTPGT
jgi:hypothetical protein